MRHLDPFNPIPFDTPDNPTDPRRNYRDADNANAGKQILIFLAVVACIIGALVLLQ